MWDDDKQRRLDDLQRRAEHGTLSADEQRTLDHLLHEVEQHEWSALRPELNLLRQEQGRLGADLSHLQTQNAILAALAERYADLLARAKAQLTGLVSEREALRTEYERLGR